MDKNTWAGSRARGQPAQVFLSVKCLIDKKGPRTYSDEQRTGGPFAIVEEFHSDVSDIGVAPCLG